MGNGPLQNSIQGPLNRTKAPSVMFGTTKEIRILTTSPLHSPGKSLTPSMLPQSPSPRTKMTTRRETCCQMAYSADAQIISFPKTLLTRASPPHQIGNGFGNFPPFPEYKPSFVYLAMIDFPQKPFSTIGIFSRMTSALSVISTWNISTTHILRDCQLVKPI